MPPKRKNQAAKTAVKQTAATSGKENVATKASASASVAVPAAAAPSLIDMNRCSRFTSATSIQLITDLHAMMARHVEQSSRAAQLAQAAPSLSSYGSMVGLLAAQMGEIERSLDKLRAAQTEESRQRRKEDEAKKQQSKENDSSAESTSASSSPSAPSVRPSASDLSALFNWLLKEGGPEVCPNAAWEFELSEEGVGVRAKRELKKGEKFMSIPRRVILSPDTFRDSKLGRVLSRDQLIQRSPSLLLSICVLYERERGERSFFEPYIRCLPRRFHLPLTWRVDEVKRMLQGSQLVYEVLSLQRALVRNYLHLYVALNQSGVMKTEDFPFHYDGFVWGVCVVMSRQNSIPCKDAASSSSSSGPTPMQLALIPGFDMCNHRASARWLSTFFHATSDASVSYAAQPVSAGQSIHTYYGKRPNFQFFLYAAFVDVQHERDEMELMIRIDGKAAAAVTTPANHDDSSDVDPMLKIKQLLLKRCGLNATTFTCHLPLSDPDGQEAYDRIIQDAQLEEENESEEEKEQESSESKAEREAAIRHRAEEGRNRARLSHAALMHFIRVCTLTSKTRAEAALKWKPDATPSDPSSASSSSSFPTLPPLDADHARDAFAFLISSLRAALDAYPTTLEQDDELLLQSSNKTKNDSNITGNGSSASGKSMSHRRRLAIQMQRAEKKLILQAIERVTTWSKNESTQ